MKNLKRTLAIVTAIATMLAAVPAFADLEANVIDKDNTITVTQNVLGTSSPTVTVTATNAVDGEMTFLILDDGTDVTNIGESDILYIDQQTYSASSGNNSFTGVINLGRVAKVIAGTAPDTALPDGDYPIRLGYTDATTGNFRIAKATLKVAEASSGTVVSIVWGDVNCNGNADTLDATAIMNAFLGGTAQYTRGGYTYTWGKNTVTNSSSSYTMPYKWGDLNCNGNADTLDATAIMNAFLGGTATFEGRTWGKSSDIILTPKG